MGNNNSQPNLFQIHMNLKLRARTLEKNSKIADKNEIKERNKIKKAIEQGSQEKAHLYAQNAIRNRNVSKSLLQLACRIEAVSEKIKHADQIDNVMKQMTNINTILEGSMDSQNIVSMSNAMTSFEKSFENLDVYSVTLGNTIDESTATLYDEDEIREIISLEAEKHSIDISNLFPPLNGVSNNKNIEITEDQEDDLTKRLAELRSQN